MKSERDISPLDFIPQLHLEPIVVPPRKRPRKRTVRQQAEEEEAREPDESFRIDETMDKYKHRKRHE